MKIHQIFYINIRKGCLIAVTVITMLENTKIIQVDILSNFGNTGYQKISKDMFLKDIPNELYELWYSPDEFSFIRLIDLNNIQYLSNNELSEYYSQLIILKNKLEIIFNDISIHSDISSQVSTKDKTNLLQKIYYVIRGGKI